MLSDQLLRRRNVQIEAQLLGHAVIRPCGRRQLFDLPECKPRRVDVDDLVALALALEATPNRLLLGRSGRRRIESKIGLIGDDEDSSVVLESGPRPQSPSITSASP